VPLHTADAGSEFGLFVGEDRYTTTESERLVRLPMWYGMSEMDQLRVVKAVKEFYE
jgi:dTDP-4-amino-4,6-dideoxygalactose transaminase